MCTEDTITCLILMGQLCGGAALYYVTKLVFGVNAGIIREEQADTSEGGRIAFGNSGLST